VNPSYGMQMPNVMAQNMAMGVGIPPNPMYMQNHNGIGMMNVGEYPMGPGGSVMMVPQYQAPYPAVYSGQPMPQQAMYAGAGMVPPVMAVQPGGIGQQKPVDAAQGGQSGGGGGRYVSNSNNSNDSGGRNSAR
jgi:hypothetical protein